MEQPNTNTLVCPITPGDPNFATLDGQDDYARYFDLLYRVFSSLLKCYEIVSAHESHEASIVREYVQRLLYTVQVLRMKYTYHPETERNLWIDLTSCGFQNHLEVNNLSVDLAGRESLLADIPSAALLKRQALDVMIQQRVEPMDALYQLSRRTYLEMLDPAKLFLQFTPGTLTQRSLDEKYRGYLYSWGCYDFETNLPFVHLMTFYQDIGEEPLEKGGQSFQEFLRVVASEGSRAPDVGTLALLIDDALEPIHPKTIKRIKIGPICSRLLVNSNPCEQDKPTTPHCPLQCPLRQWGQEDDFILFFEDDIVMSQRQQFTRSVFAPRGRIREVYWIPEADPECYRRHASVVHHYVLLPHELLQNIGTATVCIPHMVQAKKFVYTQQGDVYGI